jgi:hypothetical protein
MSLEKVAKATIGAAVFGIMSREDDTEILRLVRRKTHGADNHVNRIHIYHDKNRISLLEFHNVLEFIHMKWNCSVEPLEGGITLKFNNPVTVMVLGAWLEHAFPKAASMRKRTDHFYASVWYYIDASTSKGSSEADTTP